MGKKSSRNFKRNKASLGWQKLALNQKFTILILSVLAIPIIILFSWFTNNMLDEERNSIGLLAHNDLEKLQTFAYSNSRMANSIINLVQTNPQVTSALTIPLDTKELLSFHSDVTAYFESISVTNTYIRSVRIYTDTDIMPERYPVFLDSQRVAGQGWFENATSEYVKMRANYDEALSSQIGQYSGENLISFFQKIPLPAHNAVIEVSFDADGFFGDVFASNNSACLVQHNDNMFFWNGTDLEDVVREEYSELVLNSGELAVANGTYITDGGKIMINGIYCEDLNVNYYIINDLETELEDIKEIQALFSVIYLFVIVGLALVFQQIAKVLLARIYTTIEAMNQLETGDTLVQIENTAEDELGQLQKNFNKMVMQIDDLVIKEARREVLEKDAQLKALQNQINAHFLYNVLNNIEMMAIIDENFVIADTVTALARLLRYSMKWDKQMVPLASELEYVRDYIQLFNMRFDNQITLICDLPPDAQVGLIPKMSVQPVVENALIHGIEQRTEDELIRIAATIENGILTIGITDTGIGMDEKEVERLMESFKNDENIGSLSGIGLKNVQERIVRRFGDGFGVSVQSKLGEYTKVTLTLPLVTNEK